MTHIHPITNNTEASDPLAATLENVPLVPGLADTPSAALIDLVAFTNGQTGTSNPQRQGLSSAIKDGMSPLNIAANTPAAAAAYSPLWAVNLAKWVGKPGDRQTSVQDVQALAAEGKVASFNPKDPASNPPLAPSGIVVNCPIIATVSDSAAAAPRIDTKFLESARDIDLTRNTVVLPLHPAVLPSGTKTYFIVTEASTAAAAKAWGANHAPSLSNLKGTAQVQAVRGASTPQPGSVLQVPATVDFTHGKRSVTPNPTTGFPPTAFSFSAQGNKGKRMCGH